MVVSRNVDKMVLFYKTFASSGGHIMNPMRKYVSRSCVLFTVVVAAGSNHPNSPQFVSNSLCDDNKDLKAFSPSEFRSFPVTKITTLSHNTKAFECALPSPAHETGMAVSSCIMVKGTDGIAKVIIHSELLLYFNHNHILMYSSPLLHDVCPLVAVGSAVHAYHVD